MPNAFLTWRVYALLVLVLPLGCELHAQPVRRCSEMGVCTSAHTVGGRGIAHGRRGVLQPLVADAPAAGRNRWKVGALLGGMLGGGLIAAACAREGCMTIFPVVIEVGGGGALGALVGKLLGPATKRRPNAEPCAKPSCR